MRKDYLPILILLLFALLAGVFLYIGIGSSNTAEQLSLIYRMNDSSYLANDWFVNINEGVNVRFYSSSFILILNKFISNLGALYFLLFLSSCFLIGLATYYISKQLFNNKRVALLTAFFVIFGANFTLGGVAIMPTVIVSSLFSMIFILWGFYFFLKKKYLLFSLMFGVSIFFHFLLGGLIFGILLLAEFLLDLRAFKKPFKGCFKKYFKMISLVLLAILIISPIFISQISTSLSLSGTEVVKILGEIRNPHHHMPFSWAPVIYAKFFFFFFLFLLAFKNAFKNSKLTFEKRVKSLVKNIVWIILVIFCLGTVFVEIIPISFFVKLQLFRVSLFLSFIGYLFIIPYLYKKVKESVENKLILRGLYCFLLMISLFSSPLILMTLPIFIIGEYLYYNKTSFFMKLNNKKVILGSIIPLAVIFYFLFLTTITTMINSGGEVVLVKVSIYILFISFMFLLISKKNKLRILWIILILLLTLLVFIVRSPIITNSYDKDTQEMYSFIKEFTPKESILLTPPHLEPFRLGTERAIVVDFKLCPYGEIGLVEWYERLKDVSNNVELDAEEEMAVLLSMGYNSLSEGDILSLKKKYNFSYVIFERQSRLNFTSVFENNKFVVYDLT